MRKLIEKLAANRSGATAFEYGLLAGLIAVVIIGAVTLVGTNLNTDVRHRRHHGVGCERAGRPNSP